MYAVRFSVSGQPSGIHPSAERVHRRQSVHLRLFMADSDLPQLLPVVCRY